MAKPSFIFRFLTCLLLLVQVAIPARAQVQRKRTLTLMGGRFDITIIDKDSLMAEQQIDTIIREISRIEDLISDWRPASAVSQINAMAGIEPVVVDRELLTLTQRALHLSEITGGKFDISFAAMDRIWKFDGSMTTLPTEETIRRSVAKVNYRNIIIDTTLSTIFLKEKGMKIGFGALGEGYAADRCRNMMLARGVPAGIVNASGDMATWGRQINGKPWQVGITDPFHAGELLLVLPLSQPAIVTSGNYEKFVLLEGRRYTHIIDPSTGWPVSGIASVTVFGPEAETANGLSTSIMVLGKEKGMALLDTFPAYQCLLITDKGEVIRSRNLTGKKLRRQLRRINRRSIAIR